MQKVIGVSKVLFDLDGTLTDPKEGTVNAYAHLFRQLGRPCPPDEHITPFIGPPLAQSLGAILKTEDKQLIDRAVMHFREHYDSVGLLENTVYDGISVALNGISKSGAKLYVATAKAKDAAVQILDHFDLTRFFDGVYGNVPARTMSKGQVIADVLKTERLDPQTCIMVGDRSFDVIGAQENKMPTIGVTWGYGSREELREALMIVDSPRELASLFSAPGRRWSPPTEKLAR